MVTEEADSLWLLFDGIGTIPQAPGIMFCIKKG